MRFDARAQRPPQAPGSRGFTLIEVLVALGIVALVLVTGQQASLALVRNAQRESDVLLAQLCADNALAQIRLAAQMPGTGDTRLDCEQAGRQLALQLSVQPTPNPNFLRVDARAWVRAGTEPGPVLHVATVIGRY